MIQGHTVLGCFRIVSNHRQKKNKNSQALGAGGGLAYSHPSWDEFGLFTSLLSPLKKEQPIYPPPHPAPAVSIGVSREKFNTNVNG